MLALVIPCFGGLVSQLVVKYLSVYIVRGTWSGGRDIVRNWSGRERQA